jgi:hypothetical protein
MVRLGPSASNKQPWRIVRDGRLWHFYLLRTPRYIANLGSKLGAIADIQRLDMGIAMCHFELTALEKGLGGQWVVNEPMLQAPEGKGRYVVSWRADGSKMP